MDLDQQTDSDKLLEGEVLPHFPTGRLTKRHLRRVDVVNAFHTAFEMIGGIPRLALWADANPTEFYKLYGRLLPSQSSAELGDDPVLTIQHALPPPQYNPAKQPEIVDVELEEVKHGNGRS